jgi:hypothetical protein
MLMANANAKQGISDMGLLFTYLRVYGVLDKVNSSRLRIALAINPNEDLI